MKKLKKDNRPVVLTVKGNAAAIVQDAEAYQRLLDIAAYADAGAGIRQGLEDVIKGKVRPARWFFEGFEAPLTSAPASSAISPKGVAGSRMRSSAWRNSPTDFP